MFVCLIDIYAYLSCILSFSLNSLTLEFPGLVSLYPGLVRALSNICYDNKAYFEITAQNLLEDQICIWTTLGDELDQFST